uniref:RNA binding motif protein 34 n=1 Tax=Saimiri boliviensis boliviensis TaxID=39432 RepID=A0A2K6TH78_SAIBB
MALEGKNKRKRKRSVGKGQNREVCVRGSPPEHYEVGQVASSLFCGERPSRGGNGRLASLFTPLDPQVQPVYVPVPKAGPELLGSNHPPESASQTVLCQILDLTCITFTASFVLFFVLKRESALLSADLEEEIHQKQGQKRKKSQSGVKGADRKVLDVDDTVVSQRRKIQINQEEERLKNERTVFVGNLPVTCDKKVSLYIVKIPAEGTLSKKLAAIKLGVWRLMHLGLDGDYLCKLESRSHQLKSHFTGFFADGFLVEINHTDSVHLALKLNNSELMGRKLRVMRSVNKEKLKQQNSNPRLKNVSKPKQGLNLTSKNAEGHSKSLFIGEKAVLIKKKKKGQKKSRCTKKQRKQK